MSDTTPAPALPETVEVLVVGGGQAGLGMGYRLREAGIPFVIVDDRARIGDVWRARWRSLVLFTPRRFAALPGRPLPRSTSFYPSKDEIADYLERYAEDHALPVVTGARVTAVRHEGGEFVTETSRGVVRARAVVIATGPFQYPRVPRLGAKLAASVAQLHSSAYRSPDDLPTGRTAVVGGGNSAAQLAVELAATREVTMVAPAPPWFIPERILGISVYWPLKLLGILGSPAESRISRYIHSRGDGILGTEAKRAVRAGRLALRTSRVVDAEGETLVLADGSRLEVDAVLWATGFRTHYPFVQVDGALTEHGAPVHDEGVSPVAGLYWIGLPWQSRLDSSILHGIAADSRDLLAALRAHLGRPARSASARLDG
ncbi:NAD(P)/FAD-dependent oxidoreductase [Microcella daejeonensis]|uniref:NAD(P)/FAD-dependent oxidoreductase n=1 Tax=Microcella daejeonensis TaxID=2994971 RepID=A0A9E8MK83_9MICO|nr:NAD(P)/FAD-dependent oxidoreductase [Microcella daejeonensis]WAB81063.1 NAD(P)/FAD-dependent oxidoreductase [Microcella daejeonensis]